MDVWSHKPPKKALPAYPNGFSHIDLTEAQTTAGKRNPLVAFDRDGTSDLVELVEKLNRVTLPRFAFSRWSTPCPAASRP